VKRPAPATPPVPASNAAAKPETKGRNAKELQFLLDRQKEFKMAALNAKKQGDIEQAKNHLKASKVLLDFLFVSSRLFQVAQFTEQVAFTAEILVSILLLTSEIMVALSIINLSISWVQALEIILLKQLGASH
jgi:hypothetical protein